jgi:quinoprotein glucose dehydrogenase
MRRLLLLPTLTLGLTGLAAPVPAADPDKPYTPDVKPASDEAARAMKRFRVPQGVEVRVWAAEPLLANPVCFAFDEKGRCYVAETFRLHHGVTDNRGHMNWLDDDLASRTVEDRVAMYRKYAKDRFASTYEVEHERVRLIEDTKGAGVADKATVFADGFKHAEDGIGAGLLARKGNVYYTCIPDLWLLKDTKGTGKADVRQSLARGFGVHVAFLGHDMHGLRIGPDGRLYFSLGDRGLNVKTKEGRHLFYPDGGAVLRCELDGSNLEIVYTGLRNPQELAFDQYGNLFTVDNNSDSGDRARLTYIVEGGDSGWRTGYQYGSSFSDRGPFNAEKIWHLPHPEQPAYVTPPLAHITSGPSGLCYNYGATALPERYKEHFFICDFRGSGGGSGVYSFAVKPKGAAFEIADGHEAFWSILATDCDFGPDGGFYISDWVDGWNCTGKGRLYRFADPQAEKNPAVAETKNLLAEGFEQRPVEELAKLLEHPDMRVRQEAQFALVDRGKAGVAVLRQATKGAHRLARLHGIWGLGQIVRHGDSREDNGAVDTLLGLLNDQDSEVRVQAIRSLEPHRTAALAFVKMLKDPEPRVRLHAAVALRQEIGNKKLIPPDVQAMFVPVRELLADNADKDPFLRHAGITALTSVPPEKLKELAKDESPSVRIAAVVALRKLHSPMVAAFLDDADPLIRTEAARAIHDEHIDEMLPALAAALARPNQPEFLVCRALNAHYRLGKAEDAAAVAAYAARPDAPEKWRIEAVKMLGEWGKPPRRDRITGLTQDLGTRDDKMAVVALRDRLGGIFAGPDRLRREAATVSSKLGIKEVGPVLLDIVRDKKASSEARVETLRALASLRDIRLEEAVKAALADTDPRLRAEARHIESWRRPSESIPLLEEALEKGDVVEQQSAFTVLGEMKSPAADKVLAKYAKLLVDGKVAAEVRLDLLEAATARANPSTPVGEDIKKLLVGYESNRPKNDPLAAWSEALVGGDAEHGRALFLYKSELSCVRCHKVNGQGGDVGPELAGIAAKQDRRYLLESIVLPNAQIAKGYETVVLQLKNGKSEIGIVKVENDKEVRLITAEGKIVVVPKDKIEERMAGKSAMPEDVIKHMSKRDLRDLVEYLASLKEPPKP